MKLSAVLLNWRRPANAAQIVTRLAAHPAVGEVIVWDNGPDEPFAHPAARVVRPGWNCGVDARFTACTLARGEAVLIQDDDLLLPPATVDALLGAYEADPAVVHGVFGRRPRPDGSYAAFVDAVDGAAEVILTRACVVARSTAVRYFPHVDQGWVRAERERVAALCDTPDNGEDILLSHLAWTLSGRLNAVHALAVEELPSPHALCHRRGHVAARTLLFRACFGASSP
jgi:hypothetical protein